jgi:glucose-6-phosphate 1-dehydrogenase
LTTSRPPAHYAPGSEGPAEADALLAQNGHRWLWGCHHG